MRKKFLAQIVLTSLVAAFAFTGCKNKTGTGNNSSTGPGSEAGVPPLGPDSGVNGANGNGARPDGLAGGELQHGQFAPVYFDFDSARIRPGEDSKIGTVAAYLKANPGQVGRGRPLR